MSDPQPAPARRRPRADALRNRQRLLAEADAVFREEGTGASLEGVARRAGVAIGTLYGHFPTRAALIAALLEERNQALFAYGAELAEGPDPAAALAEWVRAVVRHAAAYQGLADQLSAGNDELNESCAEMTALGDRFTERARAAGVLRGDTTGADLFTLMNAAAWSREHDTPEQADRLLDLALAGMLTTTPPPAAG
ncbi:TetR/AcrR family transcriptional regulator [Kitasatospora cheerisanensis]|uniref:Transcriptional regulator n=1 Tax=Kitasatospora cheerisanensis KCTC 2395 TaxID=1348663 RepID=A0A066YZC4_9ACTN|nr:TetR/AcrR family transcriptional regulator [Kitasatospora cheerisanensis]KDN86582.1 transcriptional regulator [Kitasatospora cheerisanensis KCTC 2395]